MSNMHLLAGVLAVFLLTATAAAETVYKYRRPDGRTVYSSERIPGLELIETFDYKFPPPEPPRAGAAKSDAEGEARIRKHLDRLQAAWTEVQAATQALAAAEERLRVGMEPQEGERLGIRARSPGGGARTRLSPEYVARVEGLESDVKAARARLDAALRRYNDLR